LIEKTHLFKVVFGDLNIILEVIEGDHYLKLKVKLNNRQVLLIKMNEINHIKSLHLKLKDKSNIAILVYISNEFYFQFINN